MAPTLKALVIADQPDAWRAAGFAVDPAGTCWVGSVALHLDPTSGPPGTIAWQLAGVAPGTPAAIDGIPAVPPRPATSVAPEAPPGPPADPPAHPLGVVGLDHVVCITGDLARTVAALERAGAEVRRWREGTAMGRPVRQAFFRLGPAVLEVVGDPGPGDGGPAHLWGLAFTVADLDAAVSLLGEERCGSARPAVQPGRRIASLRRRAGVAVPVALLTPHPAAPAPGVTVADGGAAERTTQDVGTPQTEVADETATSAPATPAPAGEVTPAPAPDSPTPPRPPAEGWARELSELGRRETLAKRMGGREKVARQHSSGRLTVRERIERLVDPGSFHEVGALAGRVVYDDKGRIETATPANLVFGRARLDGRTVVVSGDDFTVRGGAADAAIWTKQVAAEEMAGALKVPLVRLLDGTGGGGSVKTLEQMGHTIVPFNPGWDHVVANLATVPVVALALGPVAGLGAARFVSAHLSILVERIGQVFVAGPPLVAAVGETVSKEELGGSAVHARSGVADVVVPDEDAAFALCRRFLSYLPASVHELPPRAWPAGGADGPDRRDESLLTAIPRSKRAVHDVRAILNSVFDLGSILELGAAFGPSAVTALARLDGWPVAVLATDPRHHGGCWTAEAADKIVRFVDLADTFHLPVVHLVDQPGFLIGTAAERAGTIRRGARAVAAIQQSRVPWCSVIIRRVFGVAGAGHQPLGRRNLRYAWPSGDWGSLPFAGGIEAAYRAELEAAPDPVAARRAIEDRLSAFASPLRTAEAFMVEEIIDPRDTRPLLCEFANLAAKLRTPGPTARGMRP